MKWRGRRQSRICANYHPLAVLHRFNHSNSDLTRQPLRDPGTLATLDINHEANTPMFNTDKTLCHLPQCVSLPFITLTDYPNNQGTHRPKEYVFSVPQFFCFGYNPFYSKLGKNKMVILVEILSQKLFHVVFVVFIFLNKSFATEIKL